MNIKSLLNRITDSYFFIIIISLSIGIIFSDKAILLYPYVTIFLGIIFFLSSLKIEINKIFKYFHDKKMILIVNLFMLIILPALIYYITLSIFPSIAIAFLILAAMPTGMTAPLLSELSGGKQDLALVFTVTTSLLAPITVPFIIKFLAGAVVSVSFSSMFISLAKVIFIPFFLAQIIKRYTKQEIIKTEFAFKGLSVFLLSLLIIGIVAKRASEIIEGVFLGESLYYLIALFIFFIILHILGYFTVFWRDKDVRKTVAVALTYMNFTLAIYLVDQFFSETNIVIPVILSVVPWALLLAPYKFIMSKIPENI